MPDSNPLPPRQTIRVTGKDGGTVTFSQPAKLSEWVAITTDKPGVLVSIGELQVVTTMMSDE